MNAKTFKAAYYTGNKQFALEEVSVASPAAHEVQIEVAYCGICGTDMHAFHGVMDERITLHRVIGHEMSGTIVAAGGDVDASMVGKRVVVRPLDHCGDCPACNEGHSHVCHNLKFLGLDTDGAFQQRWNTPAHTIHEISESVSLAHAALIEPIAVACHDVSRARLQPGEDALVIGGGPIGLLVAMVAKEAGANVMISEINEHRLAVAKKLGFRTLNPLNVDVITAVNEATGGKGADVVFEVSGSAPGVELMTEVAACRGRIVMVAIHPNKPQVDMFKFFWRELELLGARVYEGRDFDKAIELLAKGAIDADTIITDVNDLDNIQHAFSSLDGNAQAMKSIVRCNLDA